MLWRANSFADALSKELGAASAACTKLKAYGCGSDVANHIGDAKDEVEKCFLLIKQLVNDGEKDKAATYHCYCYLQYNTNLVK